MTPVPREALRRVHRTVSEIGDQFQLIAAAKMSRMQRLLLQDSLLFRSNESRGSEISNFNFSFLNELRKYQDLQIRSEYLSCLPSHRTNGHFTRKTRIEGHRCCCRCCCRRCTCCPSVQDMTTIPLDRQCCLATARKIKSSNINESKLNVETIS